MSEFLFYSTRAQDVSGDTLVRQRTRITLAQHNSYSKFAEATANTLTFKNTSSYIFSITSKSTFIIFAEDTSIVLRARNTTELPDTVNETLSKLYRRNRINPLGIRTKRTNAVLFAPKTKPIKYEFF